MSRHTARESAFQLLYQLEIRPEDSLLQMEDYLQQMPISDKKDRAYFERLIRGVTQNLSEIDEIISKYLRGWTMDRQLVTDLAILRLAVFELLFDTEVPAEIAISEAVIFANEYGTEESRSFINAVLGSVAKTEELRTQAATKDA